MQMRRDLNLKVSSPSDSTSFGSISKIPEKLYGCPPYANSGQPIRTLDKRRYRIEGRHTGAINFNPRMIDTDPQ